MCVKFRLEISLHTTNNFVFMTHCVVHGTAKVSTFHPWASPVGMERPVSQSCPARLYKEWIPATHCHDGYERRGFHWYYAAVGCSDMLVHLGHRTLIARNRCHAAALLSDTPAWWTRINYRPGWLERALRTVPKHYNATEALEYLFTDCVRGVWECVGGRTRIRSKYLAYHRCYLSGSDTMSAYIAERMRVHNYSSLQLLEQPEASRWNMNHEIFFLRAPVRRARRGTSCMSTTNLWKCLSCTNAPLIQNLTRWRSTVPRVK